MFFPQHQLDKEKTSLPQGRFLLRWLNLAESLHSRERNPQKGNVAKAVAFHEQKAKYLPMLSLKIQLDKERTSLPQGRFLLRWLNLAETPHLKERNPQKGKVAKAVAFHEKKARKTSFIARAHTWKVCNWTKNAVFCRFLPWKVIDLTSLSFYIIQGIAEKRKGLKPISKR